MKIDIRRAAVLLVIAAALAAFAGCGQDKNNPEVLRLDGYSVPLDEYRYFYLNYSRDLSSSGDYSDAEARLETEKALRSVYALYSMAKKYGVRLSDEEKRSIDAQVSGIADSIGGEEYAAQMKDNYITENVLRSVLEQESLEMALREAVYAEFNNIIDSTDAAVEKDIAENFIRVKQIMIRTINPDIWLAEGQLPEGHEDADAEKMITEIKSMLDSGADFDELVRVYNEDIGMNPETGYYITRGEFLESFEDAAFALGVGETSGIVRSVNGYHIIRRYEQDPEYVSEYFEELRGVYKARRFNELRQETADSMKLKTADIYDTITRDYLLSTLETEAAG
ncbi:MAG: peptidylprolyl isomerase [Clostridiales bacterium]|nr:peptidylprolyl isomerase [Clostridiales bacterium]